jgi:hypothetical protein
MSRGLISACAEKPMSDFSRHGNKAAPKKSLKLTVKLLQLERIFEIDPVVNFVKRHFNCFTLPILKGKSSESRQP